MKKVLIANRGEIATRVIRACHELGLQTVAIYAKEDEFSVHRFKADEAYLVGAGDAPIAAYLDIEDIIRIAKENHVDAIHPGYGFLAENATFARRVADEGMTFIGPTPEQLDMFGDKITAKQVAQDAGVQTIPSTLHPVSSLNEALQFTQKYGFPIMIKAAMGGGGRGMRIVREASELQEAFDRARSEAKQSFGDDEIYLEKFIAHPKHIEVQILGDSHGNVMHLYERDCSVQRRNQKVIEFAPAVSLPIELRQRICNAAVDLMKSVHYLNAATVEFLVEGDQFYFMEVNPRIQVEHTVTEMITEIDIVHAQLKIAMGGDLFEDLHLPHQDALTYKGAAIQCRVTTEDPANDFMPDTGRIETYRSPGGNGVRLDAGNTYSGAVVTPYYDSLLVKACVVARNFKAAVHKMRRVLVEFDIRGVKTNIPFMLNVIDNPTFQAGEANTRFIDNTPSLFKFPDDTQQEAKMLKYIGNTTVNGFADVAQHSKKYYPDVEFQDNFKPLPKNIVTAKDVLDTKGVKGLQEWLLAQKKVLLTDTTMRDAHQSLFATRMRTKDMLAVAGASQKAMPELFSYEMWGGATFDVAFRFLNENPWDRLRKLRKVMPRTLFQMLFRGSNAVGYQNYPDNVIREFILEAAKSGIDVFRIFDSLNWIPQMEKSIQAVKETGKIAEATICYTGDIMDPNRQKYDLNYYRQLALDLQSTGADIIAIKDMAGVLKPEGAYELISTLKDALDIPVHLHTHDTTGNGIFTYARAVEAGVDVVDVAASALSGTTSQPSMSSLYYALAHNDRQPAININNVEAINRYWQGVRPYYQDFSNGMTGPQTDIYQTQMPGGQYSNLQQQAKAVGLGDRWEEVKDMYATVNDMFGDIIKVTPSSKVVGDMALFMMENNLTPDDVYDHGEKYDFPDSVINFFAGNIGQPVGGFPKKLQKIILKDHKALTVRPGSLAKPVDFEAVKTKLQDLIGHEPNHQEVLSYIMYPKVFLEYMQSHKTYGHISLLDTPTFFQGMRLGETVNIELAKGKTMIVKLNQISEPDVDGIRTLYFSINGQNQEITVKDNAVHQTASNIRKAEPTNENEVGATMSGSVLKLLVQKGDEVKKGQPLIVTEAMKMETTIQAPEDGVIAHVYVSAGDVIQTDDLLIEITPK
ncbi:pyruvate carboxylase [Lactiplantibacillus modestisalitolerans]|uniref:Pyruvate carboxylase n=1 Tax=Lactiplantibacillus modestisalitolerans TaxID=1457219 RepID=A0ABV5WV18_9LACO|nr:pyruvate carboxylase [Lactiplantibacillus modestisalitolerans]